MECAQHPGVEAVGTCIACGQAICEACRETVAGHPMCHSCVAQEQERVRSEVAADASATPEVADGSVAAPGTAAPAASPTDAVTSAAPPPQPCGFLQYVKAVLFAGIAAVLGALIWDKFALWTGIQLGLIAVAVGWVVATALCIGAEGRPGKLLPVLGAVTAAFGIMLGYAMLMQDTDRGELARNLREADYFLKLFTYFLTAPFNLDLMDWVFVAIGVWEGWSIPSNLNRQAATGAVPESESPAPIV